MRVGIEEGNFNENSVAKNFLSVETLFGPFCVFVTAVETNYGQSLTDGDQTTATGFHQRMHLGLEKCNHI